MHPTRILAVFDHWQTEAPTSTGNLAAELRSAVRDSSTDLKLDIDGNRLVTPADRDLWTSRSGVRPGDTNFDNLVDYTDFVALSRNFGQTGGWGQDGASGDGRITFADFVALSANFAESAPAVASVPEPGCVLLASLPFLRCSQLAEDL